jgi:hypothetical protein
LISNAFDEELSAIGFEEELAALDGGQCDVSFPNNSLFR